MTRPVAFVNCVLFISDFSTFTFLKMDKMPIFWLRVDFNFIPLNSVQNNGMYRPQIVRENYMLHQKAGPFNK